MPPKAASTSSSDNSLNAQDPNSVLKTLSETEADERNIEDLFKQYESAVTSASATQDTIASLTREIQARLKEVALKLVSQGKSTEATKSTAQILDCNDNDGIVKTLREYQRSFNVFSFFSPSKRNIARLIQLYDSFERSKATLPGIDAKTEHDEPLENIPTEQAGSGKEEADTTAIPADVLEEAKRAERRGNWQLAYALISSATSATTVPELPEDIQQQRFNQELLDHSSENETKFQAWLDALEQLGYSETESLSILEFGEADSKKDVYQDGQRDKFEDPVTAVLIDKAVMLLIDTSNASSSGMERKGTIIDEVRAKKLLAIPHAEDPITQEPLRKEYKAPNEDRESDDPLQQEINQFQADLEQFMQDAEKHYLAEMGFGLGSP